MITSDVARRYAVAIFSCATSPDEHQSFLSSLRQLADVLDKDKAIHEFVISPLVRAEAKEEALGAALKGQGLNQNIVNLILLLARKGRLALLGQIATAYEAQVDKISQIKRGVVRTAGPLSDSQKAELQKTVETYSKSKVILNYAEDASLLGGLTAQVGSLTFDDSLRAHLKNIKEDLNRSH